MKKYIVYLLAVLMASACTNMNEPDPQPKDAEPILLRAALEKRVAQDNEFAFDLLKKTITDSGETNVFISPLSVSLALGMAWNGAAGATKSEMESTLKMSGLSANEINEYYKVMQTTLPELDPSTQLNIANSMWYRNGFPVKQAFMKVNSDYFNAEVRELDFSQAWAADTINNWCAVKTNNLIPEIIKNIPEEAMLYLINAVYFKGIWRKQFDKKATVESTFTNEKNMQVKVNMMTKKDTFNYAADADAQYLDMPYGNKAFSMTVILPSGNKTTTDILNNLTIEKWNNMLGKMNETEVLLKLPRFKVQNEFSLKNPLINMGMPIAFSAYADFNNISDIPLVISNVLHNTFITVDEEGTEAAAVTAIEFVNTSVPSYPVFTVNKPFVFVIRERSTGVILFIGKIGNVDKY